MHSHSGLVTADHPPSPEQLASIWWSIICEPADEFAGCLRASLGTSRTLDLVRAKSASGLVSALLDSDNAEAAQLRFGDLAQVAKDALLRWVPRLRTETLTFAQAWLKRQHSWVVTPESELWPTKLDDLCWGAPAVIWGFGNPLALTSASSSLAVVGSRGATTYGEWVTADLIAELSSASVAIISGGAAGIDAIAHRAALGAQLTTVAVMAGGADRLYPSMNHDLLLEIGSSGAVIAELPPGSSPTKWRFLMRNRLIAALADATLVVEAGKRSGAISTVNHAIAIGRAVGAVPGQVSASSSVGCNRLIQSGEAVLIQDSSDLLELLAINSHLFDTSPEFEANARFGPTQVRLLDALTNRAKAPDLVAVAAGLTPTEAHVAFSSLALAGFVAETDTGWVKLKTLAG